MHDSHSGIGIDSGVIPFFAGTGIKIEWNRNWNRNQGFWVGIGIGVESKENWLES